MKILKDIDKDIKDRVANNLQTLLKLHNMTINQLAEILDISAMTLWRLVSKETPNPRIITLKIIADYFNITLDTLTSDSKILLNPFISSIQHHVPLIDWRTMGQIKTIKELNLSLWTSWQTISVRREEIISEYAFALKSIPSMYPIYPQGTVFIIDPDVEPIDGDIALVKIHDNNNIALKKIFIDPPEQYLQQINGIKTLSYSKDQYSVNGVVILTLLYKK